MVKLLYIPSTHMLTAC